MTKPRPTPSGTPLSAASKLAPQAGNPAQSDAHAHAHANAQSEAHGHAHAHAHANAQSEAHGHAHAHAPACAHAHAHANAQSEAHGHAHAPAHAEAHAKAKANAQAEAHDHDHAAPPNTEHPHGTRPAETGGNAVQVDLVFLSQGSPDHSARLARLEEILEAHRGVDEVHLRQDGAHREICIHYDARQVGLGQVLGLVRKHGAEIAKRFQAKTWFIQGMSDPQAANQIEAALQQLPGVLHASVAYGAERLVVELDTERCSTAAVEAAVKDLGFCLDASTGGHTCAHHATAGGLAAKLELPLTFAAGALLLLGFILARAFSSTLVPTLFYAAALAVGGFLPAQSAFKSLRLGHLDIESLMVLAALGAGGLGAWAEGAFLLFLFSLGHAFEHRALDRARRAIESLGALRPEVAHVFDGATTRPIAVALVEPGARVLVRPGDRVPLDGVIISGHSALDQAAVTGESTPISKGPGDEVFAGTINTEGALTVEVTRRSSESVLAKVVDMVAEAEAQKGPAQRFAQRLERRFVPLVVALVVLLPIVLIIAGVPLKDALLRALNVLVAASPCALAIATPAAVLSAVARAARSGVLIKGGAYLEALGKVRAVAFDKTGTLTEGRCRVVELSPQAPIPDEALLVHAAALEASSQHPIARAVVELAASRGLEPLTAHNVIAVHGRGLRGLLADKPIEVGSAALFTDAGVALPATVQADVTRLEQAGRTTMLVRYDGLFLGVIGIADTPRAAARKAIAELRMVGIEETIMLSGDNLAAANAVAAEVGISNVRAPLMPADKVAALRELTRHGGVAMVGDGVNDAPALAAATVGIAMGGAGSDVAMETADVVLMADDLQKLAFTFRLARHARRVIQQNLFIALGVSAVLVISAIAGWTQISEAVILHEGSSVVVVLNGLRILWYRRGD